MALSYVIDHADQRVIVRMAGTFSNQEIDACYARLFADAQFVPGFDLLLDLRAPQVAPSAQEIRDRAKRSGAHKSCFSGRVAMVFPLANAAYGMGRMYSVFALEQGLTVEAFIDIREAEAWLMAGRRRPQEA